MIEGIKVDVKGSELQALLLNSASKYAAQAEETARHAAKLRGVVGEQMEEGASAFDNSKIANLVERGSELKEKIALAKAVAERLEFLAKHLNSVEAYRVDEGDIELNFFRERPDINRY